PRPSTAPEIRPRRLALQQPFIGSIRPVRDAAGVRARGTGFAMVLGGPPGPQRIAGAAIGRNDRMARAERKIQHAIHLDRSDFGGRIPEVVELPAPGRLEILEVFAVDLIKRRIARAAGLRRIGAPLPILRAALSA